MRWLYSRICSLSDSIAGQQRLQRALQFGTQSLRFLRIHIARVAAAQSFAVRLRQPTRCIDQRRPRPHQAGSRPNHRQIGLRLGAAMLHRRQQLRIDPGQPRQRLGIQPIIFPPALSDQTHVARMRHDHFVAQFAEQSAHPGRMHPVSSAIRLRGIAPNTSLIAFGVVPTCCSNRIFARFIQHAIPAPAITQVQTDRQLLWGKILRSAFATQC